MIGSKPEAVLFDLDGTLVDTAPDLGGALNIVLEELGHEPLPLETIRPHVSRGGRGLTDLGFAHRPLTESHDTVRELLLQRYAENICIGSVVFPGLEPTLRALEAAGVPWGIVTNKPEWLTTPLVSKLALDSRAACVVSGDTTAHAKPHPLPLFHAAELIEREPGRCLYVGDDLRDIEAARAARMPVLVAAYGYLGPDADIKSWGADGILEQPEDLAAWVSR